MKLFLVGGFLGSGKTTAIRQAYLAFQESTINVAVVTNDQGEDLVDTAFMKDAGVPTKEVKNGCFCCNYDQLSNAVLSLQANEAPEVIFAESVGSCADLVATIAKPFNKFNPAISVVISVFVDANFWHSLIDGTASFLNDDVRYIYKKQLEEADILVVNKIDLLQTAELEKVKKLLREEYAEKTVLFQNSLDKDSVRHWMQLLNQFQLEKPRISLDLDYDRYARGEAVLAWLDQRITVETKDNSADRVALRLIHAISSRIKKAKYPIAHLKFLLDDGEKRRKISFTTFDDIWKEIITPNDNTNKISMLLNARIQVDFSILEKLVSDVIEQIMYQTASTIVVHKRSAFAPGYPRPTHRIEG